MKNDGQNPSLERRAALHTAHLLCFCGHIRTKLTNHTGKLSSRAAAVTRRGGDQFWEDNEMFGIGFLASAASLPGGRAVWLWMFINHGISCQSHLRPPSLSDIQTTYQPTNQPTASTGPTNYQLDNRSNRDVESWWRAGAGGQLVLCSVIVWWRGMWRAPLAAQPA